MSPEKQDPRVNPAEVENFESLEPGSGRPVSPDTLLLPSDALTQASDAAYVRSPRFTPTNHLNPSSQLPAENLRWTQSGEESVLGPQLWPVGEVMGPRCGARARPSELSCPSRQSGSWGSWADLPSLSRLPVYTERLSGILFIIFSGASS